MPAETAAEKRADAQEKADEAKEKAEAKEAAKPASKSTAAKPAAKAGGGAKGKLTPEQDWENTQRERAEAARDKANKEAARRAGMKPEELFQDDRKKAQEAQVEADRWNSLTQAEQNKELADPKSPHYEPLPPWQHRLPSGRVFDARSQPAIDLIATNGTVISGDEAKEAREFYMKVLETAWV